MKNKCCMCSNGVLPSQILWTTVENDRTAWRVIAVGRGSGFDSPRLSTSRYCKSCNNFLGHGRELLHLPQRCGSVINVEGAERV